MISFLGEKCIFLERNMFSFLRERSEKSERVAANTVMHCSVSNTLFFGSFFGNTLVLITVGNMIVGNVLMLMTTSQPTELSPQRCKKRVA